MKTTVKRVLKPVVKACTTPVGSVRGICTRLPHAVLTYDDGPDPVGTERVLDALAASGATATFFVLLDRVDKYRTLLHETVAQGHEIALHGIDHRRLTKFPAAEVGARVGAGKRRLEDELGKPIRWFRPPYGAQTPATWLAIRRAGLEPVLWGPTAWDWLDAPVAELAERAMERMSQGSILLAHDGYASDPDEPSGRPAPGFDRGELTTLVLEALSGRGLSGVSLADALREGVADRWAWFRR
jgi:peptidoglycan/xylan/chitin deacetylase (PgdA/CDA1 family)